MYPYSGWKMLVSAINNETEPCTNYAIILPMWGQFALRKPLLRNEFNYAAAARYDGRHCNLIIALRTK